MRRRRQSSRRRIWPAWDKESPPDGRTHSSIGGALQGVRALLPHHQQSPTQMMHSARTAWRTTRQVTTATRDLAGRAENAAPSDGYNRVREAMWTIWEEGDGVTPYPDEQVGTGVGPMTSLTI